MKTTYTIPVNPELRKGWIRHKPNSKKPNETLLITFTRWCKSELMGKPGTPPSFQGHSTLGSTGPLCPLPSIIIALQASIKAWLVQSISNF